MARILKVALKLLATGTISLLLAACYGIAMQFKRITALSPAGAGIQGLQVTLIGGGAEMETESTDGNGAAVFSLVGLDPVADLQAVIRDVDGTANGGEYEDNTVTIGVDDAYTVTMKLK
jgi:hypothetical protein